MANYSISRLEPGKWKIRQDSSSRASAFAPTKIEAEVRAKLFAANNGGGEVRIHGLNGRIQDSDTVAPAKDPFPPRDKKH